ncbi:hypothetical protein R5W23_000714, partial [Gemmata sp. JC673]
ALALGKAVLDRADTARDRVPRECPALFDFPTYKKAFQPERFWIMTERYETETGPRRGGTQAAGLTAKQGFGHHILISRGSVSTAGVVSSLVLVAGGLDSHDGNHFGVRNSVVICDGDVRIGGGAFKSVVVARGNISIEGATSTTTLIAGGTVTIGKPGRRYSDPEVDKLMRDDIEEKVRAPLAFITFFELSTVGVEVKTVNKVV